jgi:predicted methyltransferase
VKDVIKILHQVQIVKINSKWVFCELTKKEQEFALKFGIDSSAEPKVIP